MLSIRVLFTLIVITIIAAVVVVFKDNLLSQISGSEVNSRYVWDESAITEEVDLGALSLSTDETGNIAVERPLNGPLIMEEHCSACHAVQVLELNQKSRSDWEMTLEKMEEFGLQLSQEEQSVLLDYLETK